jgi:hypothetical protein
MRSSILLVPLAWLALGQSANASEAYQALVAQHAAANGLPVSLVHRVIMRESRYNPRAVSKGNYGIMQIRLGTARAMGYTGSAAGLLDANTNMTYAVKYLAGAYRAARGNESRAVSLYASGYYYQAKAQGFSPYAAPGTAGFPALTPAAAPAAQAAAAATLMNPLAAANPAIGGVDHLPAQPRAVMAAGPKATFGPASASAEQKPQQRRRMRTAEAEPFDPLGMFNAAGEQDRKQPRKRRSGS